MAKKKAIQMRLNISKLVHAVLTEDSSLKTQAVAERLTAKMPDSKELAEAIAKPGFQSTVSIQRKKITGGGPRKKITGGGQGAGVRRKGHGVGNGKPTAAELIKFIDQTTEKKIDVAKLAETLALVNELGGADRVLALASMLAEMNKSVKNVEHLKAILTTFAGSPF